MKNNSIKTGAIISYISIFLNIIISLIYTPWMIREIGMSDYGIYSLIVSFLSYFLLDFGLSEAISRFISKFRAKGDNRGIDKMFSVTTIVYAFLSLLIGLVLFVIYFFLSDIFVKLTPEEIVTLRKVYIIAGFFSVCNFCLKPFDGVLVAYEKFITLKMLDLVQRVGTVLLITITLLLGGDIIGLVLINGLVAMVVSLMKLGFLFRTEPIKINIRLFEKSVAKDLFNFSFWVFFINIAQRLRLNIIPTILGVFCGTKEIAIFSVAMNLEGFIYIFSNALNGLFMPKVSRMINSENASSELTDLMIKVGRIQLYIVGFIIVGLFGLGQSFIHLWIGDSFSKTYYVMVFLVVLYFISMTQQIGTTVSYVVNEVKYNSIFAITTSVLSLIIALCVAPKWGAIGCGFAVFVALLVNNILMNIFYYRKLKLDIRKFFYKCHLKILPCLILFLFILLFVEHSIKVDSWYMLFALGFVYTIVFFSVLFFFVMNDYEKNLIISSILRKQK